MSSDQVVSWTVAVIVVGVWAAVALGWLGNGFQPLIIAIAVTLVAAAVAAVQFDRRHRTGTSRYLDANRPELYTPMGNQTWQVPTSYIDHPSGGGTPPGIDDYTEILEHDLEERAPSVEDEAP